VERCRDPAKPRQIKVIGKYIGSGGRIMIRLYDGAVIEGKSEVMVNDSVNVKEGKVESVIRFAKGAKCYVIKGTHSSESGTVKDVIGGTSVRAPLVSIDSGKGSFQTLVENVMVIGEQ
jgi:ribosomal protein S4E